MYKGWDKTDYYDPVNDPIRKLNSTLDQKPGGPRQCYYHMSPVPGMPVLRVGVHPVDYDDLCNLSVARADILMECFDLNGRNETTDIREEILMIATFIGVTMKSEWLEEYGKWAQERDREKAIVDDSDWDESNHRDYDTVSDPIRRLNRKCGSRRRGYYYMPPVPGMPVLPVGVYPVDYDDLCNLSPARANILMECFDLNVRHGVSETTDIREKIYIIATFISVKMKPEWWNEYERERWEMEKARRQKGVTPIMDDFFDWGERNNYDAVNDPIRKLNAALEKKHGPGCTRYHHMPPVPGMPVLPVGVYPVDYDDLCNLSVARANILMEYFDLNGFNEVNETTHISEKIYSIASFIGVEMADEYDKWEKEKNEMEEMEERMEMMDVKGS